MFYAGDGCCLPISRLALSSLDECQRTIQKYQLLPFSFSISMSTSNLIKFSILPFYLSEGGEVENKSERKRFWRCCSFQLMRVSSSATQNNEKKAVFMFYFASFILSYQFKGNENFIILSKNFDLGLFFPRPSITLPNHTKRCCSSISYHFYLFIRSLNNLIFSVCFCLRDAFVAGKEEIELSLCLQHNCSLQSLFLRSLSSQSILRKLSGFLNGQNLFRSLSMTTFVGVNSERNFQSSFSHPSKS